MVDWQLKLLKLFEYCNNTYTILECLFNTIVCQFGGISENKTLLSISFLCQLLYWGKRNNYHKGVEKSKLTYHFFVIL